MPGLAWGKSEKRPLTARLLETADAADRDGQTDLAAELRSRAQARAADPQWMVTVKVVGSPRDPLRYQALRAGGQRLFFDARLRARKAIIATQGADAISDDAVTHAMLRDPEFHAQMGAHFADWFAAGIEGGESEMDRLYALGGGDALQDAVHEVRKFNEVSVPLG